MKALATIFCLSIVQVTNQSIFTCQMYEMSPPVTNLCQFVFANDASCSYSQFAQCRYYSKCKQFQGSICQNYETIEDNNMTSCLQNCCGSLEKENTLLYNSFDCDSLNTGEDNLDPLLHTIDNQLLIATLVIISFIALLTLFIKKCARTRHNQHTNQINQIPKTERHLQQLPNLPKQWIFPESNHINFSQYSCSICLNPFPNCQTKCKHFFHAFCIGEWLQMKDNCPLCKANNIRNLNIYCSKCQKYSYAYTVSDKILLEHQLCHNCKE